MGYLLCKSRVVVVLNEVSEKRRIDTVGLDGIDHVIEAANVAIRGFEGVEQLPVTMHYPLLVIQVFLTAVHRCKITLDNSKLHSERSDTGIRLLGRHNPLRRYSKRQPSFRS